MTNEAQVSALIEAAMAGVTNPAKLRRLTAESLAAVVDWDTPRRHVTLSFGRRVNRHEALGVAKLNGREYRVAVYETAGRFETNIWPLDGRINEPRGLEFKPGIHAAALRSYLEMRSAQRAAARAAFQASEALMAEAKEGAALTAEERASVAVEVSSLEEADRYFETGERPAAKHQPLILEIGLPRVFVTDRRERDLDCGEVSGRGNILLCRVTVETLRDMLSDARHQFDGTDAQGLASLRRSAAKAVERIEATLKGWAPEIAAHDAARHVETGERPAATMAETRRVLFHVRDKEGFATEPKRYAITAGRYNMARCDLDGAIISTFVPETDSLADILAALPHGRFFEPCEDAAAHVSTDAEAAKPAAISAPCHITIAGRPLCTHTACVAGLDLAKRAERIYGRAITCGWDDVGYALDAAQALRDAGAARVEVVSGDCPELDALDVAAMSHDLDADALAADLGAVGLPVFTFGEDDTEPQPANAAAVQWSDAAAMLGLLGAADRPAYREPFFPDALKRATYRDATGRRFYVASARNDVDSHKLGEAWRMYDAETGEGFGDIFLGEAGRAYLTRGFYQETPRERWRAFVQTRAGREFVWSRRANAYASHARDLEQAKRFRCLAASVWRWARDDARSYLEQARRTREAWLPRSV